MVVVVVVAVAVAVAAAAAAVVALLFRENCFRYTYLSLNTIVEPLCILSQTGIAFINRPGLKQHAHIDIPVDIYVYVVNILKHQYQGHSVCTSTLKQDVI